jgi:pimeloyl-ACP methyl ester carboxylesterase
VTEPAARLHDGSTIKLTVTGHGSALLLAVDPHPVGGSRAEALRAWGVDPSLGHTLVHALAADFTVVAFDLQGHVLAHPQPDTLGPETLASDLLAIADAAGVDDFAYYGYSWLAVAGMQLALRTDRLWALVMGGWPPLHAPYRDMLAVTEASVTMSTDPGTVDANDEWGSTSLSQSQSMQFLTLYRALQTFDDVAAQSHLTCPRLCFVGSADAISYPAHWGGVDVSLGATVLEHTPALEASGWSVHVLDGLDHTQAMQAARVLPIVQPWLASVAPAS